MTQVKKEDKKKRILKVAMDLFAKRGFRNVAIDEIAQNARVGKGTIYIYFDSKLKILEEAAEYVFNSFTENIHSSLKESKNVEEFVENLVNKMVEKVSIKSRIMMLFHKEVSYDKKRYSRILKGYKDILRKVHKTFMDENYIPFEEFHSIVTGLFMAIYMMAENIDENRIKRILKRTLICIFKGGRI